jgi:glycolate oxidase FAD binding subunit
VNPSATMQPGIVPIFEKLLGPSSVICDEPAKENYAIDGIAPQVVLLPDSSEQIVAVLRIAGAENWTVIPFGGGTRQYVGRGLEAVDIVLSTERLNRIQIYDPGDLTISLDAGVKLDRIAHACLQHRQLLPIEAAQESTIGGALATNASGPMRTGFGGLRDFCIGINFITGDGASARGGGRVVKNVAGYDLMKLMIGSYGTLGVIVSANFKLFPLPQQTMTCMCEFGSSAQLFQFRDHLLKSPLSLLAAEVVSPAAVEYLTDIEPRNPDSWAPDAIADPSKRSWQLALRFSGSDRVLARCRKDLGDSVATELTGSEENNYWAKLRAFESRVIKRHRNAMVFHVEVPIAESQSMVEAAQQAAIDYNFMAATIGRAALGSFVIAFLTLAVDPPAVTQFAGAASNFRAHLSRTASAIVTRCPREAKQHFDVWGTTPTDVELMRKIKRALDPKGILNRGRFLIG